MRITHIECIYIHKAQIEIRKRRQCVRVREYPHELTINKILVLSGFELQKYQIVNKKIWINCHKFGCVCVLLKSSISTNEQVIMMTASMAMHCRISHKSTKRNKQNLIHTETFQT